MLMLTSALIYGDDNEIYIDQSGDTANIDLEQLGGGNIIGGLNSSDNITGYFNFDGSSNEFTIQVDPTNTYGADSSDFNVQATGDSNDFTLNVGTSAMASNTDLDWVINGSSNTLDFDINYDGGTSWVDIDGDSNSVTFDGSGYAGGYFYLDQTGDSRTFNIQQLSTLNNDWLKIISSGDNGSVCVIQDDGGTAVGC